MEDWKKELPEATIYVYNNNSTDRTVEIAKEAGAILNREVKLPEYTGASNVGSETHLHVESNN